MTTFRGIVMDSLTQTSVNQPYNSSRLQNIINACKRDIQVIKGHTKAGDIGRAFFESLFLIGGAVGLGALAGSGVGSCLGGVGALPGAIMGGMVGGALGLAVTIGAVAHTIFSLLDKGS